MKKLVLVVNDIADCGASYYEPFKPFGERCTDVTILDTNPDSVALVVFTGGSDVSPDLYGEAKNPRTYNSPDRDKFEKKVFERAKELGKPIAGICRGSQFICAMSGGKLAQHITGHGRYHNLLTDDGRIIEVSSTHHQMQMPPAEAEPIAWAEPKLSALYEGAPCESLEPDREHDGVWYRHTQALGMQYHPEFMSQDSEGFLYSQELIKRFFGLEEL